MAIDKPKGWLNYRIRFTTPSGRRIQQNSGTSDKKKAQELDARLQASYWDLEKLGQQPKRKWQEAVVRWYREAPDNRSRKEFQYILNWLGDYLKDKYLHEIDRDLIESIAVTKESTGVKPKTVNSVLEVIRIILRKAKYQWGWISDVPAVRMRKKEKGRIRWLKPEEAQKLLNILPMHLSEMAAFSLLTGLRKSNVTGLKWAEVDLIKKHAWVHPDQSKNEKAIAVPLNADALAILKRQPRINDYVFSYRGKGVHQTNTKAWRKALERAGIENFKWHDLRHTWASWHVQNGTSLHELQQLGMWSSYEMVLRYAHLSSDHLKNAAERVCGTSLVRANLRAVGGEK